MIDAYGYLDTGGPARYVRTDEGGTIGFITPLSNNFCAPAATHGVARHMSVTGG